MLGMTPTLTRRRSRRTVFIMAYELPKLPYAYDALEPHIDARTMEIHYTKHHQAYVTNLNNALKDQAELRKKSVEDLIRNLNAVPENIRTAVRNNGGGPAQHSFFLEIIGPGQRGGPQRKKNDDNKTTLRRLHQVKEKIFPPRGGRFGKRW